MRHGNDLRFGAQPGPWRMTMTTIDICIEVKSHDAADHVRGICCCRTRMSTPDQRQGQLFVCECDKRPSSTRANPFMEPECTIETGRDEAFITGSWSTAWINSGDETGKNWTPKARGARRRIKRVRLHSRRRWRQHIVMTCGGVPDPGCTDGTVSSARLKKCSTWRSTACPPRRAAPARDGAARGGAGAGGDDRRAAGDGDLTWAT